MYRYLLIIGLILVPVLAAMAQNPDTTGDVKSKTERAISKHDSVTTHKYVPKITKEKVYHPDSNHSPHKAIMHSLMIPGWGQVYNHRWWKVPVIYAGIGLLGSAVIFNQRYYAQFLALSKYRERGTAPGPKDKYYAEYQLYTVANNVSNEAIYSAADGYRRNRDLSILGVLGAWGINLIDAYIDAKFIHAYTMDNDLSFKITPGLINQPVYAGNMNSFIPGIKITFTLR